MIQLYLYTIQTDESGIGLGAELLQVRDGMIVHVMKYNVTLQLTALASKGLSPAKWYYSNIECKVIGILHVLEKFHQYGF